MFGLDPTPFDLRLVVLRVPVRVHPSFWIAGVLLSWNPERLDVVFMWVMCLFISILVHEMGHALMCEAFGWAADIVLYWCGGLTFSQRHHSRTPWREIAVSLAGPFAGFGLYALTELALYLLPETPLHPNVYRVIGYLIHINLYWGLINLLPVLPLDGGQVCQSFLTWCRLKDPGHVTAVISMLTAGAAAAYFFNMERRASFAGMLFAMLCLQNMVALQSPRY